MNAHMKTKRIGGGVDGNEAPVRAWKNLASGKKKLKLFPLRTDNELPPTQCRGNPSTLEIHGNFRLSRNTNDRTSLLQSAAMLRKSAAKAVCQSDDFSMRVKKTPHGEGKKVCCRQGERTTLRRQIGQKIQLGLHHPPESIILSVATYDQ
jgi:hypothetical protein